MSHFTKYLGAGILLVLGFFALQAIRSGPTLAPAKRIKGVNFVAPREPIAQEDMSSIVEISSNWVAIIPYAFSISNCPDIYYHDHNQCWGENKEGVIQTIEYAKNLGLKVMIKPHMWVASQGWAGDYLLEDEQQWKYWEEDYEEYIMTYASIADSLDVEMLCVGTELRHAVRQRGPFWRSLIDRIRSQYQGKLIYAANWDNFDQVTFWDKLDYIGVDAYFPLSKSKTPKTAELITLWEPYLDQLETLSNSKQKPIIFTEYGYRSMDHCTQGHWELEEEKPSVNLDAQKNAYSAMYMAVENKDWYHGGFLWKWFAHHEKAGGISDSRFTPQNKPAIEIIKAWHSK